MKNLNFGIIGCGNIARKFAQAANSVEGVKLYGAASNRKASAENLARAYGIEHVYDDYKALLRDPNIDAVYVSTPNTSHFEIVSAALEAGKHVHCEKPITPDFNETQQLIRLAQEKHMFLMEGLWTKALPIYGEIKSIIAEGMIGEVSMVMADYFFRAPFDPASRLFNPDLAGGALYDIGIYGLVLANIILGTNPRQVLSTAHIGASGVDERTSVTLLYECGAIAIINCSITTPAPQKAVILGTRGRIEIPEFGRGQEAELFIYGPEKDDTTSRRVGVRSSGIEDATVTKLSFPHRVNGFEYQIELMARAIREGATQLELLSWEDTLNISKIIARAKAQW